MNQYLKYKDLFEKIYLENEIMIDEEMKNHIYFKVGGPADIFLTPKSVEQLAETVKICRENNIPYFIIGNGSNL
ncbi:MAG: FAD-binding protein, partial [Clostridium sp.]|nr:FAD-binding protein [Clostridium sp.]